MKISTTILILALLAAASSGFAIPLTTPGNRHNLSSTNSTVSVHATTETRICIFCHTPHNASPQSQLWNRKDPSGTFPLYSSATLNIDDAAIVGASGYTDADPAAYPNGATRMCLSCHDGVSAIGEVLTGLDIFTPKIIMNGGDQLTGSAVIDLSSSHPVSFVFNTTVRDYLNTPAGGGASNDYKLPGIVPLDSAERMQCTTCHDPHEDTNNGTTYTLPFWRNYTGTEAADYDNTCNNCHDQATDWGNGWGSGPTLPHTLP